jgi:glycerol uptake facilitator-like aquaporin
MTTFAACLAGQALTGWRVEIADNLAQGKPPMGFAAYLASSPFLSALFENWESEFLQMFAFVMLTAYLFQRGSPESKDPDQAYDDLGVRTSRSPWPARVGGLVGKLYDHSLGGALLLMFLASFVLHFINSRKAANEEAATHGLPAHSASAYLIDPHFWFESMQNWQSEFFSTAVLIVLAIYLRQRGSPESKKLYDPNSKTGGG